MLSPSTKQDASLSINSSPKINAWASPSGLSWTIYSKFSPHFDPSPNNNLYKGMSQEYL